MKYILYLFFFITVFTSCQTDNLEGDFVTGANNLSINNKVLLIDTLTVEVSTINFDSLITSSQSRILSGSYTDPILGKIKSDSYLELTPSTYAITSSSNSDTETITYAYDSIAMILRYDRYYYGDTTKAQTINIHQLTQKVKPNTDDYNFYNNSALSYNSSSIGSKTYYPKPKGNDSISIKISDSFGKNMFDKLKNKEITNADEFNDYFKGIVIKPSADNSSVIGFNMSSVLRLYYKQTNSSTESKFTLDFAINDISKQFNNISLDRTGTIIQNLPDSRSKLSSRLTNNSAFIQSGTGLACRVDFPYLNQLKYLSEKGLIVDAELVIKPIKNSASALYPMKDSLRVYECDNLNRITGTLTKSDGSAALAILNNTPDEFNENIGYKINLGSFLYKEMIKTSGSKSSLIFAFPNIYKGVDRIVLGNQKNAENRLQLKIYYISY